MARLLWLLGGVGLGVVAPKVFKYVQELLGENGRGSEYTVEDAARDAGPAAEEAESES
ncbi:MAG: hypothetical protein LBO66_01040 [Deltaproteobacteria bacterium]|jgi:hypothetical protein|nr:hypothetical protein [Deltaproteobacteria bacterium]